MKTPTGQAPQRKTLAVSEWDYLYRLVEAEANVQSWDRHLTELPSMDLLAKLKPCGTKGVSRGK